MAMWCVVMVISISGCQTDISAPAVSVKWLYKGENDNQEYLSRGTGQTSSTGWSLGNKNLGGK